MLKSITEILINQGKFRVYFIILLSIITSLFDIIGIASIYPLITILTSPNLIYDNTLLSFLFGHFNFSNTYELMFFSVGIFLGITIFSILFKILATSLMFWFVLSMESSLSIKVLKNYLSKKYEWFIEKEGSILSKNILSEVNNLVNGVLMPSVLLFSNLISISAIITMLLIINFKITIGVFFLLSLSYFFIFKIFKKKIDNIGSLRFKTNEERFKIINETFNTFRETKLFNIEQPIVDDFDLEAKKYANSNVNFSILSFIPKLIIEILLVLCFGFFIFIIIENNIPLNEKLPILSLFLFAGYRLLPALQQIYSNFSRIKFYYSSMNTLKKIILLNLNNIKISGSLNFKKEIYLKNIKYKYPFKKNLVLNKLSLQIKKNTTVGIYGKTGTGKSTLVDILSGLLEPSSGQLYIDNKKILYKDTKLLQKVIGYVPQVTNLLNKSIIKNVAISNYPKSVDINRVNEILKKLDLYDFVQNLPKKYNTKVGDKGLKISGGQRQRIGIARALYKNPKILILDEATNSLDVKTENLIIDKLNKLKNQTTIIIISHNLNTLKNCDETYELLNGKLILKKNF